MTEAQLLIDLVKDRPAIYNSSLMDYKSKTVRKTLWEEIAETMNKDVSHCRTVWSSLRSSYARHLQNMENNLIGINKDKKTKWYLADRMAFLNEFMLRPPTERSLEFQPEEINNTANSMDDNSMSYSCFYNKSANNSKMDDNQSIVEIKSEFSEETLSYNEEIINQSDDGDPSDVREPAEEEDPFTNYNMKKCRVELTTNDQNILTTLAPESNEIKKELPKIPVAKRFKSLFHTSDLMAGQEIAYAKAREESTVMFFQSILFDLRKLSDRKLRFFKQDVLQDLNKYLDKDENE